MRPLVATVLPLCALDADTNTRPATVPEPHGLAALTALHLLYRVHGLPMTQQPMDGGATEPPNRRQ